MNKQEDDIEKPDNLSPLIIFFIIIVTILVGSFILTFYNIEKWEDRASFGDSFGAVNTLFSGLAFGGIIYTILLQRKELALQRKELSETRKELKRSADAQENSEKALIEQIKAMKKTAILNGYNSIVESQNSTSQLLVASGKSDLIDITKRNVYINKILDLIRELEEEK